MRYQLPVAIETKTVSAEGTTIYYPQVKGLANEQVQASMNAEIIRRVNRLVSEQKKYLASAPVEMTGHYEIKTNERGILSLTLSNYAYAAKMAHGMTLLDSLTFDVNTGKSYQLSELFKPGSDYVAVLSRNVAAQIKERDLPLLQPFQSISPNQSYYLADKALVLYFALYEITPYYVGFPMFPISVYELASLVPEDGPISILSGDIA